MTAFRPLAGASVEGDVRDARRGRARGAVRAAQRRHLCRGARGTARRALQRARARHPGRQRAGPGASEFAVDAWSLETARVAPDSATLAAVAEAGGGSSSGEAQVGRWAQSLETRALVRPRRESLRLWESPWVFALVVALLATEWAWRRRRGLP